MSEKSTLRAWTFFREGQRIQGAHEYTPPAISVTKTAIRTGAQDAPTPVDDGLEELTCQVKFYGFDANMLASLGFVSGNDARFTAYQGYIAEGRATGSVEQINGFVSAVTPDARGNAGLSENAMTVDIAIKYYKKSYEGRDIIEIDTESFMRKVNGVDMFTGLAAKVRI